MKEVFLPEKVMAFSDGIFDLPFLKAADIAICVRPDRKLKKIALKENWDVI